MAGNFRLPYDAHALDKFCGNWKKLGCNSFRGVRLYAQLGIQLRGHKPIDTNQVTGLFDRENGLLRLALDFCPRSFLDCTKNLAVDF